MDIHRCRFVPYPASPINALAFTHSKVSTPTSLKKVSKTSAPARLAIGRANGDIEVWNPLHGQWHQEVIIRGGKDRSVDALVWVTQEDEQLSDGSVVFGESRLFSIGYSTTITEWDLEKSRAKAHASGQHGEIWCLAAQPRSLDDRTQRLVAGTSDGSLVLYSIDDDDLRFQRTLVKTASKKVQMVSLAFQSRQVVIVGCSDSSIRAYDLRNGAMLRRMTLGSDLAGGSKEIIVWSVKCLPNGDIVSGDSTGQICIWDGRTYTQAQRIDGHNQDVLSLAVSGDGSTIISGGMDRRTAIYKQMSGNSSRWTKVWHRRYHGHDVKTLAVFESKTMSVVVSGGPDANPIVIPLRQAGMENHRTLSHLPQNPPLQGAPRSRTLISWWDREVHIWKLQKPVEDMVTPDGDMSAVAKNRKLLGRILIKGQSNISSASISSDGALLVVSTVSDIKAFYLQYGGDNGDGQLKITRVNVPESVVANGATKVQLSPDGSWLCVVHEGSKVAAVKMTRDEPTESETKPSFTIQQFTLKRLRRVIPKNVLLGGLKGYDRNITQITFSSDSKMLAVADLAGYIDTWVLQDGGRPLQNGDGSAEDQDASSSSSSEASDEEGDDDDDAAAGGPRWVRNPKAALIPKLPAAPTVLSFSNAVPAAPSPQTGKGRKAAAGDDAAAQDYVLLAITTSFRIFTFHPLHGALTKWARRNHAANMPDEFRAIRDLVKGVVWQGPRAWLYGASFLFMLDMSADFLTEDDPAAAGVNGTNAATLQKTQGTKRKRGGPDTGAGSRMMVGAMGPHHVRMAVNERDGEDGKAQEWVDVEMADADEDGLGRESGGELYNDDDDDEDDDDDAADGGELRRLRDRQTPSQADGEEEKQQQQQQTSRRKWWQTYKYRPILGLVAFCDSQEMTNGADGELPPLEVALVERPIWDVDLPDRYLGEDEHKR